MSITDELRDWFEHGFRYERCGDGEGGFKRVYSPWFGWKSCIEQMLDRIDAAADGTVELPKDADGVPIRVGDVMERMERCGKVVALQLSDNPWGDGNHWAIQLEGEQAPTVLDAFFHHYHAPTVEDVLREFAQECLTYATNVDDHEVVDAIEKYAKRLTLAGEDE
ncbi:MAG: hypothetical protein IKE22_11005 [Atopobiaceae bacterium]|nr:hypothetical protein [Atopobiaceae bacterium]